jgi:hypothetical protein
MTYDGTNQVDRAKAEKETVVQHGQITFAFIILFKHVLDVILNILETLIFKFDGFRRLDVVSRCKLTYQPTRPYMGLKLPIVLVVLVGRSWIFWMVAAPKFVYFDS